MAKELPYFKFEPSLWDTGNIQLCTHEAKGIFIDICSMYWQRIGDLPYKLALQKACNGNATALQQLIDENIIKVIEGEICIDFLNEQLSGFENISSTNSENARSGWEKRRKNATARRPHNDRNAIREEESREEEKKKEEKSDPLRAIVDLLSGQLKVSFLEWIQFRKEKGVKITPSTARKQIAFLGGRDPAIAVAIINQSITMGWTGLFELKSTINGNGKQNNGLTKVQQQQANNLQSLRDQASTVFGAKP